MEHCTICAGAVAAGSTLCSTCRPDLPTPDSAKVLSDVLRIARGTPVDAPPRTDEPAAGDHVQLRVARGAPDPPPTLTTPGAVRSSQVDPTSNGAAPTASVPIAGIATGPPASGSVAADASDSADADLRRRRWTIAARVGLLVVGLLGVVVILLVVAIDRALAQGGLDDPAVADQVLAAQQRLVTTVLPAFVAIAIGALALALWRATGPEDKRASGPEVPIPLWLLAIAVIAMVVVVVGWSEPQAVATAHSGNRVLVILVGMLASSCLAAVPLVGDPRSDHPRSDHPGSGGGSP